VSVENLTNAYRGFGLLITPAELREDLLVRRRVTLGLERPDTLRHLQALAHQHDGHGRRAEGLPLHEQMLTMQTVQLGRDHPDTLARMRDVASRYAEVGRHPDALKLRTELLALHQARGGRDHPDTLSSMAALADTYASLGRHNEGILLLEERLALAEAKLDANNPVRWSSRGDLYRSYVKAVQRVGALQVREDLAALGKAEDDADHPSASLLWRLRCLAEICVKAGRHAEAVKLYEEQLALEKSKFGPEAPDTLFTMDQLAYSYFHVRRAEAIKVLQEKLAIQMARLGPDHLDTLASADKLADGFIRIGRYADALKLFEETQPLRRSKLGSDHPATLGAAWSAALALIKLKRGAEAVPLIDQCVKHAGRTDMNPRMIPSVMALRLQHFEGARDVDGCRATAELWEKLNRTDADSLYTAAGMRAATAAVIRESGSESGPRAEESAAEADRAMAWLRKAVAAGFQDAARAKRDGDLAALRDRDDFIKLIADLEEKAKDRETARPTRKEAEAPSGPAATPRDK
jgi:tetratricopeptide (TPR) repeat protein